MSDADDVFKKARVQFDVPAGDAPVVGWVNIGGPIDRSGGDQAFILAMLSQMTREQRAAVIEAIRSQYCECGGPNDCQCWDDE